MVGIAEQAVGGAFQEGQGVRLCRHTAEDAEDELDEDRGGDQAAVDEVSQHGQMADVVALEFKPRAALGAHFVEDMGDVAGGVLEHHIVGVFEERFLPVEFEVLDPSEHGIEGEVHRPHVEAAHFGRVGPGRGEALVKAHDGRAAGGHVDDGVGPLGDGGQEGGPVGGVGGGVAGVGVPGVEVQDGGASLGGADRGGCDVLGPVGQVGGLAGDVDRAGDGARDDDFGHGRASGREDGMEVGGGEGD